jgi:hypothetical protein
LNKLVFAYGTVLLAIMRIAEEDDDGCGKTKI